MIISNLSPTGTTYSFKVESDPQKSFRFRPNEPQEIPKEVAEELKKNQVFNVLLEANQLILTDTETQNKELSKRKRPKSVSAKKKPPENLRQPSDEEVQTALGKKTKHSVKHAMNS